MTPEIRQLFAELVPLDPEGRTAELDRRDLDPETRREIEELLAADGLTDSNIDRSIRDAAASFSSQPSGLHLGVWRTTGLLGQGGMGVVYRAERTDGTVEQIAAIKLLYRGLETEDLLARFQRERSILARLSHPNIARFLDAGATSEGLPWFAMEFIDGVSLDRYCEDKQLSGEARVQLLIQVCAAVQHAHRHLVIHRDIKPDNILVTAEGIPVLLDFGIAQVLGDARPGTPVTRAMTPDYASPEQLRGEPATTSTDVYLLGAVLKRLLQGPGQGDLSNILRKAMHEDPARRYATPAELATDLTSWLNGQPVSATPDSFVYRTRRFVARHRWPVAIAALAFLATAASAVIALNQARIAQKHFRDVRTLANTFLFDFEAAISNLDGATRARELVVTTAHKYLEGLHSQAAGDRALQRELAEAWSKLARIQGSETTASVGQRADAVNSYRKAVELRQALGDDRTSNPELRRAYLQLAGQYIGALAAAQRAPEALVISTATVASAEGLLRAAPDSQTSVRAVFSVHHNRAILCLELSDSACAIASADRSLAVVREWGTKHPVDRRNELDTCNAEVYVAQTALVYGNYRAARDAARSATVRSEQIEKMGTSSPGLRRLRFVALQILGKALSAASPGLPAEPEEAVAALRKAVALATTSRDKDPGNALAIEDVMSAKSYLGGTLAEFRPAEAVPLLEPLRAEMAAFSRKYPDNFTVRKTMLDVCNDLGMALRRTHRPEPALQQFLASLAVADALLADSPNDAIARKGRVISLISAARAEFDLKRMPAAFARLDAAQEALAVIVKATPADASLRELGDEISSLRKEHREGKGPQ